METLDTRKGAIPMYLQLYQILKHNIETHVYPQGEMIPSEAALQKQYSVSRITVRQAIAQLEQDGLVERTRGKGTKVLSCTCIQENLGRIKSFTDEMLERGMQPGTLYAHIEMVPAGKECAEVFHCAADERLYRLDRIRTADDNVIVYFITYFSKERNLPLDDARYQGSMYQLLKELNVSAPIRIKETIHAVSADKELAEKLRIAPHAAVLVRSRISYDAQERVLEYTLSYYSGDIYSYTLEFS